MPIASVSLRLSLSFSLNSCVAKFRIEVPSRGISYVVKDIASLLQSVKNREFVAYGKKLAFVHSRDAFDERSRNLLDVLSRAGHPRRHQQRQQRILLLLPASVG